MTRLIRFVLEYSEILPFVVTLNFPCLAWSLHLSLNFFAARARNEFDVLIQVVRGEALVSCFPELQEEGVVEVLLTATFGLWTVKG